MANKKKTVKELSTDLEQLSERVKKLEGLVNVVHIKEVEEKIKTIEVLIL